MERRLILDYDSGKILARLEKTNRTLVDGVRLRLRAGECTALIGETGSGKTMTALSIMRLLPDNVRMQGGVLLFGGRDLLREKNMRSLLGVEFFQKKLGSGEGSRDPARLRALQLNQWYRFQSSSSSLRLKAARPSLTACTQER